MDRAHTKITLKKDKNYRDHSQPSQQLAQ